MQWGEPQTLNFDTRDIQGWFPSINTFQRRTYTRWKGEDRY